MYGMTDMPVPHTQNALVPQFDYDVWFRTICPDCGFSAWVGPFYLPTYNAMGRNALEISAYPNPTKDRVKFEHYEIVQTSVYDANGAFMFKVKVTENQLDLTKLQTGTYTLIATDKNGKNHSLKVIIK